MSAGQTSTYLNQGALPFFFCPGCGHGAITNHLDAALVRLQLDPRQVVIVTDIGCSGLADRYFTTNAFHGLHGRSITYATGIKLANPELKVIVLMGDGGCGIGGHHLINAARRNIGIAVVVFNNLNYGMTGGQHSVSTPPGGVTSSTPFGQLERPMDICMTAAVNGAGFAARATAFDKDLPGLLAQAIQHDGFAVVDVWELCTAYYAPTNRFGKKDLLESMQALSMPPGIIQQQERPEFSKAYRESSRHYLNKRALSADPIEARYENDLDRPASLLLAGSAGMKINSAAANFCRGALLSGLWASQRNDYPVTVKSGHSVSDVTLAPDKTGLESHPEPGILVIPFREGLAYARNRLARLGPESTLYLDSDLLPVDTPARVIALEFRRSGVWASKKQHWAIMALAYVLQRERFYPLEALLEAVSRQGAYAKENRLAVQAANELRGEEI
jgi:2-oxoglutarate/2-oxoacid ferredoxin oxidoreductase subunit beta